VRVFSIIKPTVVSLVVASLVLAYAFFNEDGSIVEIEYVSQSEAKSLPYVEVILGDDKAKVVDIAPNEVKSVRMKPSQDSLPILSGSIYLNADIDTRTSAWMGEDVYPRGTHIRVRASINDKGEFVEEKSCKLPYSLD
jgi:uncharacterized protein involved in high-affinity Fe2+ transport